MKTSRPTYSGNDLAKVRQKKLTGLGYLPLNVDIPTVTATGNRILAINDLNNDKLDDLITSNADGSVITVFYYDAAT